MLKRYSILLGLLLACIALGVYLFSERPSIHSTDSYTPTIIPETEIPPETVLFYGASGNEARVTFTGLDATIEFEPIGIATLKEVTSGSGGLYTDENETLTLWDRGDKVSLWRGDELLFEGYGEEPEAEVEEFVGIEWMWEILMLSDGSITSPRSPGTFTLTFDDGRVTGKTDCNGFSGVYTAEADRLSFSELVSTLLYCEGSQEDVFTNSIMKVHSYRIDAAGNLLLYLKDEGGSMLFKPL